jgi:hypothetical protein
MNIAILFYGLFCIPKYAYIAIMGARGTQLGGERRVCGQATVPPQPVSVARRPVKGSSPYIQGRAFLVPTVVWDRAPRGVYAVPFHHQSRHDTCIRRVVVHPVRATLVAIIATPGVAARRSTLGRRERRSQATACRGSSSDRMPEEVARDAV